MRRERISRLGGRGGRALSLRYSHLCCKKNSRCLLQTATTCESPIASNAHAMSAQNPSAAVPNSVSPFTGVTNARRWTIVWLLFAASLINYFDRQTLSFAMPLVAKEFNLDPAQQGVVLSAFFWSYTALQIPIGLCADRFNLRWLYA